MKPTFAFEKGVLQISTPGTDMRIRWQPTPLAEHRLPHGKWTPFRPEFRILAPESPTPALPDSPGDRQAAIAKQEAFRAFRSEIPPTINEVTESFGSCQWPLMLLAGECQAGLHGAAPVAFAVLQLAGEATDAPLETEVVQMHKFSLGSLRRDAFDHLFE